jgi:hypothetical protein
MTAAISIKPERSNSATSSPTRSNAAFLTTGRCGSTARPSPPQTRIPGFSSTA